MVRLKDKTEDAEMTLKSEGSKAVVKVDISNKFNRLVNVNDAKIYKKKIIGIMLNRLGRTVRYLDPLLYNTPLLFKINSN